LVSAWADKFKSKPLVPGDAFVEVYLQHRLAAGTSLLYGKDQTLSFAQFAEFASATAHQRLNAHWNLQDDLLNMPGLELNLIGRVERFAEDFRRVLDRIGSARWASQFIGARHRASQHFAWQDYYTPQIAKRVYCAYECDFDRFGYPQTAHNDYLPQVGNGTKNSHHGIARRWKNDVGERTRAATERGGV
jgi:hypothetical protein